MNSEVAVVLERKATANLPVTMGMVFPAGRIPAGYGIEAVANKRAVPAQMDQIARHADGSVRFAVLTFKVPSVWTSPAEVAFIPSAAVHSGTPVSSDALIRKGFQASVSVSLGGRAYTADAASALAAAPQTWLSGPEATEFSYAAPLRDAAGVAHPLLAVRFNVRTWGTAASARVDVVVENNWSYRPNPTSYTYDLVIRVGNQQVYSQPGVIHLQQARWRKTFAWGETPDFNVRHLPKPMIAAAAIPAYDTSLQISANAVQRWVIDASDPLRFGLGGRGSATAYMPATGGRPDIGLLPGWTAVALLSGDAGARDAMIRNGNQAASWPIHYRDERTGKILLIDDYPFASLMWNDNDKYNPTTGRSEAFPKCTTATGGQCYEAFGLRPPEHMPLQPDTAHQPSLAYVPYLVTGDQFLFEELAFWANYVLLSQGPYGRGWATGLVHWDEVRSQAWSLRTLAQVAFVSPEGSIESRYFTEKLVNSLNWYLQFMVNSNPFGYWGRISNAGWDGGRTQPEMNSDVRWYTSPWQTDFMIAATNWIHDMGFTQAKPVHDWLAKFVIGRYSSSPGYNPIYGAPYQIAIEGTAAGAYTTWKQLFDNTFTNAPVWSGMPDLYCAYCYSAIARSALSGAVASQLPKADLARAYLDQVFAPSMSIFAEDPTWALVPRNR